MKCKSVHSILYLYRQDEVTEKEKNEIERHLHHCASCAAEAERIKDIQKHSYSILRKEPILEDKSVLINSIMRQVQNYPTHQQNIFDRLINPLFYRPIQYVFGTALSLIVGVFIILTHQDAVRIEKLEQYALQSGSHSIDRNVSSARMSGFISSIPSNTKELGINPEQVLWIKEIFNMLRGSQSPRKIPFVEYFAKKYPGLASITVENGIDDSERRILSTEGAAFMKELEQLIQSGDRL